MNRVKAATVGLVEIAATVVTVIVAAGAAVTIAARAVTVVDATTGVRAATAVIVDHAGTVKAETKKARRPSSLLHS